MIADTLQREIITSTLVTKKESNRPFIELSSNTFMLGLAIESFDATYQVDLNNGSQYFSFQLSV